MNKVFLMGHLGHSPELTISKTGRPYTRLNLATKRSWVTNEDRREEKTDWHSVFVWGPLAEQCCHNLRKGALVFVEGSLTYWQVAQTDKEYKNAIHGHEVKFLNPSRHESPSAMENLDNPAPPRNHNAVAHPA